MSNYSEGAIHALANQLEKAGFSAEDVHRLGDLKILQKIRWFLQGNGQFVIEIDCNTDPFVPDGWKVEEHIKGGELHWNPDEVELWLCDQQKTDVIEGNQLRKLLKGKSVLNANVLDYLLKNPQLIPDEWKGKAVFFWGTIYRDSDGNRWVRYLCWAHSGRWDWGNRCLGHSFYGFNPAALACK